MSDEIQASWMVKIQETLTDLVMKVTDLTASIAVKDQHRSLKDEEYERRLQNHGDRIRELESKEAARSDHGDEIKSLRTAVGELRDAVNKNSWVPVLVTGVLVSVIAAVAVAVITNSLTA